MAKEKASREKELEEHAEFHKEMSVHAIKKADEESAKYEDGQLIKK